MIVYVIQSEAGTLYVGTTTNMKKRLFQHNTKQCKSTRYASGWKVLHRWRVKGLEKALALENFLQHQSKECILDIILDLPLYCPQLEAEGMPVQPTTLAFHKRNYTNWENL